MPLNPKESGEYIVKNAKHIKVNRAGIERLAEEVVTGILTKQIDVSNFSQHQYHPKATDPIAANWVFLIDTLNFCFWTPGCDTKWQVNGETGYFAICAAIKRAIDQQIDITNPKFYANIGRDELTEILRSDDAETQCPLLDERIECLREVGRKLLDKYEGNFENCIRKSSKSAEKLLKLIVEEFPCFKDEAMFEGKAVSIYKRAQILVGDIWSCYRAEGLGEFDDIHKITMFADYRVPQVLIHFGCLEYDELLLDLLKRDELLKNGCREEVEIRGASIYIVEQLKDVVLSKLQQNHPEVSAKNVNSILLDHFLWDYRRRQAKQLEHIPFHKTISIYY